jgi:hypothetical protein
MSSRKKETLTNKNSVVGRWTEYFLLFLVLGVLKRICEWLQFELMKIVRYSEYQDCTWTVIVQNRPASGLYLRAHNAQPPTTLM